MDYNIDSSGPCGEESYAEVNQTSGCEMMSTTNKLHNAEVWKVLSKPSEVPWLIVLVRLASTAW